MSIPLEELLREKRRRAALAESPVEVSSMDSAPIESNNSLLEALLVEKKRREDLRKAEETNIPKLAVDSAAKGAMSLADLPEYVLGGVKDFFDLRVPLKDNSAADLEYRRAHPQGEPIISGSVKKGLKKVGYDLDSEKPKNAAERLIQKGSEFMGSAVLPGLGQAGRALKGGTEASKYLNFGKTVGKEALTMGAAGIGAGGLQEMGVPPIVADLVGVLGVNGFTSVVSKMRTPKGIESLSSDEIKIANALKSQMSPEELENSIYNLKNYKPNKISGYKPLPAEAADSTALAQMHRVRKPVAASRIAEAEGVEHDKLVKAFEDRAVSPIRSEEVYDELKGELGRRKTARTEATSADYDRIKGMDAPLDPRETNQYLKDNVVRGQAETDLENVRKQLVPRDKRMDTPKISEVWATKKATNAKIKANKKADKAVVELIEIKQALEKDLEAVPLIRETDKKYRALSEPIDEIRSHPKLKQILKSRANNAVSELFDKNSKDNIVALKKVLGNNKEVWSNIQDAAVNKIQKDITNAGAKGSSHELSYHKLNKFMDKHEGALGELFTKDQLALMQETQNILGGQNIAKTKGIASGSPTQANIRTEKDLQDLLGIGDKEMSGFGKAVTLPLKAAAKITHIDGLVAQWSKGRNDKIMDLLDKSLRDKEFATKLLEYKPSSQQNYNKFLNQHLYKTTPMILWDMRKEQKEKEKGRR